MSFEKANEKVHPVESQWHYNIMSEHGFVAITKFQVGFVRAYDYMKDGHKITVCTGASADYWNDLTTNAGGYHGSLAGHLSKING